ncbi:MAG: hypothetical protein H6835_03680 [Planctomycetes bacterium]|nr:hypothetical protein [Planctomycetota bacterium]
MLPRLAASVAGLLAACATSPAPRATPDPSVLIGTWRVDLRPTPDADPYFQEFVVDDVADGLRGSFYGTAIADGRINGDWGALRSE